MNHLSVLNLRFAFTLLGVSTGAWAQVAVTDLTYGEGQNGRNSNQGGVSFRNEYYSVDTVTTAAGDYHINGPLADSVYIRRNNAPSGGPDNTTLFYQLDNRDRAYGTGPSTAEDVMTDGNLFTGLRDPFANTGSSNSAQNSNIERIDFYFGDYVVQEGAGFILFDLENVGNNGDAFRLAAFDSWDSSAASPDSYTSTGLLIGDDAFGDARASPTDNSILEFGRATYTDGDDLSGSATNFTSFSSDLAMVGILIRFTDLGLSVGDTMQGFSLMAPDVTPTASVDLVDWTNNTVFHTDTDRNTHGNVDFMGFGAQLANPVPEPSSYGAIFMALLSSFYVVRRRHIRP
ncbi:MAG: PEP-CTERM sorting domain-containing protein [Candidatus Synoicihabitans palmerolidicus]|nr:PEP-CTERM sorting domain-containing protein [Candidatus Synoicihabitans palmerolidicus]